MNKAELTPFREVLNGIQSLIESTNTIAESNLKLLWNDLSYAITNIESDLTSLVQLPGRGEAEKLANKLADNSKHCKSHIEAVRIAMAMYDYLAQHREQPATIQPIPTPEQSEAARFKAFMANPFPDHEFRTVWQMCYNWMVGEMTNRFVDVPDQGEPSDIAFRIHEAYNNGVLVGRAEVEPDRDLIFREELERRWDKVMEPLKPKTLFGGNVMKLFDADQKILDTIKSELLKPMEGGI